MCHDIYGCVPVVSKRRGDNASEAQTAHLAPDSFGLPDASGPDASLTVPAPARSTFSTRAR